MGAGQSSEPTTIRIEKEDIPEQYRTVGVSADVVRRVAAQQPPANSEEAKKLRAELERERAEKARLREEMAKLTELQARRAASAGGLPSASSLSSDIEERKRIFEETVQRVEKQFFSYQRENVCSDNEKQIMECLSKNKGKVLKCAPLADLYEKCVADFRSQVLSGN